MPCRTDSQRRLISGQILCRWPKGPCECDDRVHFGEKLRQAATDVLVTYRSRVRSRITSTAVTLTGILWFRDSFHSPFLPDSAVQILICLSRDTVTKYESSGAHAQSHTILECDRSAAAGTKPDNNVDQTRSFASISNESLTFAFFIPFEKSPCPISRAAQNKVTRVTESYAGNRQIVPWKWSSHLFPCRSIVNPNDGVLGRCSFT